HSLGALAARRSRAAPRHARKSHAFEPRRTSPHVRGVRALRAHVVLAAADPGGHLQRAPASAAGVALGADRHRPGRRAHPRVGRRPAAMGLHRLVGRRLDALTPRPRQRELPSRRMRSVEAWALLVASIAAYVAASASLGSWFLRISPVPLVAFALYPYLKRF